jgi:hypothetical protein
VYAALKQCIEFNLRTVRLYPCHEKQHSNSSKSFPLEPLRPIINLRNKSLQAAGVTGAVNQTSQRLAARGAQPMTLEEVIRQIIDREVRKQELTEKVIPLEVAELHSAACQHFGTWETALKYSGVSLKKRKRSSLRKGVVKSGVKVVESPFTPKFLALKAQLKEC